MGNAGSQAPDALQVVATVRPDLAGLYHCICDETVLELEKGPEESIGLRLSPGGNHVTAVRSGSPAARCGGVSFLGRTLTHVDDLEIGSEGPAAGTGVGKTKVVLRFAPEAPLANGMPVYAKAPQCRLYGTREGKWMLTDAGREGMDRNAGHLMTGLHGDRLPHEDLEWMTYRKDGGQWEVDYAIAVAEVAPPQFRVGQLVEARREDESTELFRDAHVRQVFPADVLADGQRSQYTVEFVRDSGSTVPVPAACVRAHSAYRSLGTPSAGPAAAPQVVRSVGTPQRSPAIEPTTPPPPPPPPADPASFPVDVVVQVIMKRSLDEALASYPDFKINYDDVDETRRSELREMWTSQSPELRQIIMLCHKQKNFDPLTPADAKVAAELIVQSGG